MFFASRKIAPPTSSTANTGMTYEPSDRFGRGGACALTSVATSERVEIRAGGGEPPPARSSIAPSLSADEAGGRSERLHREQLLPGLLVDRDRHEVRVAGLRDGEVAEHAVRDADTEDPARDRRPVAAVRGHR